MESSHLVIFSTSDKFITKFNVLRCISLSEPLFWTGARGRIPITLRPSPADKIGARFSNKKRQEVDKKENDCWKSMFFNQWRGQK